MVPGTRASVNTSLHSYNRSNALAGSVAKATRKPQLNVVVLMQSECTQESASLQLQLPFFIATKESTPRTPQHSMSFEAT